MVEQFHWPPLESNPDIFEKYCHQLGLPATWGFGDLYGLDEDLLEMATQPVMAVIINSERLMQTEDKEKGNPGTAADFYMKQSGTLDNACGIIACIHAILSNLGDDKITLQEGALKNFHSACLGKTPEERAAFLEGFAELQQVHTTFASQGESAQAESQDEVKHHFVAFVVNSAGQLIELDGTKQGPHVIAEACTDVLRGSAAEIQRRITAGEISEDLSMMTLNAKEQ